jgi:hypothetical protein
VNGDEGGMMKKYIIALMFMLIMAVLFVILFNWDKRDESQWYTSDEDIDDVKARSAIESTFYKISGTVKDKINQRIPDIQIMLLGNNGYLSTRTDEDGYYQFSVPGTRYTLVPCKYEYITVIDNSKISGEDIVRTAEKEIGNKDGSSPGRYHGHDGGWCSEFVSWVYRQAGEPFTGGEGDGGICDEEWNMSTTYRVAAGFGRNEDWQFFSTEEITRNWQEGIDNPLEPKVGDYVFFSNEFFSNEAEDNRAHSGIVEEIQDTTMYTIEGNVNNIVKQMTRSDWRTDQEGDIVVKGIGFRRIVSKVTFKPRFFYFSLDSDMRYDFVLERYGDER